MMIIRYAIVLLEFCVPAISLLSHCSSYIDLASYSKYLVMRNAEQKDWKYQYSLEIIGISVEAHEYPLEYPL